MQYLIFVMNNGKEESLHRLFDMDTSEKVKGVDHYNHLQVSISMVQRCNYHRILHMNMRSIKFTITGRKEKWNIFYCF